ncbi:endonuclease III domain-containing protein [Alicyclobacillaceae bacterium I2511]|nr:endonuclease III domain-containing protein [Alicyclobacillaceae bacterium I2511]
MFHNRARVVNQRDLLELPLQVQLVDKTSSDCNQTGTQLLAIYSSLQESFGDLHWWPADTDEEMVIGSILVQNVAWKNVVQAIELLRDQGRLSFRGIFETSQEELEKSIRSTRFYRTKAKKLKAFATYLNDRHDGSLKNLLSIPMHPLRIELLNIYGIGRETADDILLYAAHQPSFVIDTYTVRIFERLGYSPPRNEYEFWRSWFMKHLPAEPRLFNQYHALLDRLGHHLCTTHNPRCSICPLQSLCTFAISPKNGSVSSSPHALF